ncbi:uncharacterized protein [Rutidosis leptorrhynchoides]|uniref:uncharacterized protein n=1 Tax=Rutidosis leptorrhynchoides TaxID=125765 RepID=UPI003A9A3277
MLRACVLEFSGSWDTHLPLVEFAYNNSYHSNIGMPPYKMLYGKRCRTPSCWLEACEKQFAGHKIVQHTAEKVAIAREKLKAARDRQKMYANPRRQPVTFAEGERVYLKMSPWKGVIHFGKREKLAPRYIGLFNIRQCKVDDEIHILPLQDLKVDSSKKLVEEPVKILDRKVTKLRRKHFLMVLVEWKHSLCANLTWEIEELMKAIP